MSRCARSSNIIIKIDFSVFFDFRGDDYFDRGEHPERRTKCMTQSRFRTNTDADELISSFSLFPRSIGDPRFRMFFKNQSWPHDLALLREANAGDTKSVNHKRIKTQYFARHQMEFGKKTWVAVQNFRASSEFGSSLSHRGVWLTTKKQLGLVSYRYFKKWMNHLRHERNIPLCR